MTTSGTHLWPSNTLHWRVTTIVVLWPSNTRRLFRHFSHRGFWRCILQLVHCVLCVLCVRYLGFERQRIWGTMAFVAYVAPWFSEQYTRSFCMYHAQCNASATPLSKQHQVLVPSLSGHLPLLGRSGGGGILEFGLLLCGVHPPGGWGELSFGDSPPPPRGGGGTVVPGGGVDMGGGRVLEVCVLLQNVTLSFLPPICGK